MKFIKALALVLVFLFMPSFVKADTTYKYMNLEETLEEEGIEFDFKNYKETDDQITIYLFRGKGCGFCKKFLTFLNSITDEYGKYFKLRSYEVWYDKNNYELLSNISEFLDEDAGGVPFIVIGDKVFPGYHSSYDEMIKQTIKELYNSTEKYDVIEKMQEAVRLEQEKEEKINTFLSKADKIDEIEKNVEELEENKSVPTLVLILSNLATLSIAVAFAIILNNKTTKKLKTEIETNNRIIQEQLVKLEQAKKEEPKVAKKTNKTKTEKETNKTKESKTTKKTNAKK